MGRRQHPGFSLPKLASLKGCGALPAWRRPFHNLRASRETELANEFPLHVVCEWIGNSVEVARKPSR